MPQTFLPDPLSSLTPICTKSNSLSQSYMYADQTLQSLMGYVIFPSSSSSSSNLSNPREKERKTTTPILSVPESNLLQSLMGAAILPNSSSSISNLSNPKEKEKEREPPQRNPLRSQRKPRQSICQINPNKP